MGIVKSLIVFAFTSIILFLITFFSPSYHEVNKESLNSMLKTFKYSEGSNDFKEINNILDSVPTDVTVMYKDKIITSNINRSSQEKRIAEGEKELSHLTKSAQSGDLTLNYQSDNPAYKYTPYIIVLLAGLFSGFAVFWLERKAKKEDDMTDYLKGEVQRLEMLSQSLEAREKDFSKKIEKHIPTTLDEAQKFLKTLLKEKEVMLVAIENHKISEDKLQKSIEKGKYQISETEEKLKEVQTELSKLTRQDKLIEELKARHEKHKTELKEHKQKISELEKLDVQKFESEIDVLKNKLAELDQKYQESKIQTKESKDTIQEMSKYDGESLTKENKELKEKIDMMEDEAKEYQEMMSNSSVGELVREKQEKEEIKKELKQVRSQLESALSSLDNTDAGKVKKNSMELTELNRTLSIELAQLKRDLEKSENSESIKMDMMRTQLFDKSKEGDDIKEQLNNALAKLEQFENPQVQTDNPLSDNYLTQIKHLENDIERLNHDSERFKRERDDKITNFEELNEAFKDTNFIIHQKDQEMSIMEEKIKELESKLNVSR